MIRRALQLALLLLLIAVPASAQTAGSTIDVVQVNITEYPTVRLALDIGDASFDPDQLAVSENGVPVDFVVDSVQPVPADYPMAILVDAHPDRVAQAQALAKVIIDEKDEADRVRLIPIDGNPGPQITTQSEVLLNIEANSIAPVEATRLYDALSALPQLFGDGITPQIYIISAGVDVDSTADKASALAAIDSMDVTVVALEGGDGALLNEIGDRVIQADNRLAIEAAVGNAYRPRINRVVATFDSSIRVANEIDLAIDYRRTSAASAILVPNVEEETLAEAFATFEPQLTEPLVDDPAARGYFRIAAIVGAALAAALLGWIIFESYRDSQAALSRRLEGYATRRRTAEQQEDEEEGGTLLARLPIFRQLSQRAEGIATERGLMQPIANLLESANLPWKPGEAVTFALTFAVILALAAGVMTSSVPLTIITGIFLVGMVYVIVNQVAARDRKKFEDQLPSTLGLLATSLRSGQSFLQAMEAVATEAPQPTAREYNRAVAEVRLGRTVGSAMSGISRRMGSTDFEWVVMSTEIQREVGGNLAEVLDIVGDTMLQRTRLRREVRALSAEGRFSAGILLLMPIFLVLFLYANNRPYLMQLTQSTTGWILVGTCLGLMAGAIAWVRKIVDIEV